MRGTYQNGNKFLENCGEPTRLCPRRSPLRRATTLAGGLIVACLMAFQAVNQPATSFPAVSGAAAIGEPAHPGYRADVIDDIIDLINDLLGGGDDDEDRDDDEGGNP